jgi:hypothetical protein
LGYANTWEQVCTTTVLKTAGARCLRLTTDTQKSQTGIITISTDLNQICIACDCRKSYIRLQTTRIIIIIACQECAKGIAGTTIINGHHSVVATAAQANSNGAVACGGITVPNIRT